MSRHSSPLATSVPRNWAALRSDDDVQFYLVVHAVFHRRIPRYADFGSVIQRWDHHELLISECYYFDIHSTRHVRNLFTGWNIHKEFLSKAISEN